ncbi:MAG: ATP-binding protein [Desulfomonilia bacterium]|jgi:PAS domain S-box-containing protein|nr:PAS domain-containing protein [Deltaproteobacteria bacterium]MDX9761041.1 PAS domain-containing protein [Desulfomonilia bacterium]HPW68215.1 PAS domain-containing protein [Deltaproteobacteria bacterium]
MDVFWYGGPVPAGVAGIRQTETLEGVPENSLLFLDDKSCVQWDAIRGGRVYLVSDLPISTPLPEQVVGVIPRDTMVIQAIITLYTEMRESYDIGDRLIRSLNEKELAIQEKQKTMLRDSKRYNAIIRNASDLIFALGPTGKIMFCNETVQNYLVRGTKPVIGRALVDYVVDEDKDLVNEMVANGFRKGVPSKIETRFRLAGGRTGIFSCMSTPLSEDGRIYALSVIGRDITDIRSMQYRISLQAKDLTLMINGLSHELRNPLTVIGAYMKRIEKQDNGLKAKFAGTAFSGIHSSIQRIEEMIVRIEQYENMVNRRLVYARRNLLLLVSEVISRHPAAPEVAIEGNGRLMACTDACHVQTAFSRILDNAVETGSERFLVTLSRRDGFAHVSLRDYGPGVKDDIESIFAPFTSSDPMKIGLGLTEARMALAKIGSHIEVIPQANPGAVFTLRILMDRRNSIRDETP